MAKSKEMTGRYGRNKALGFLCSTVAALSVGCGVLFATVSSVEATPMLRFTTSAGGSVTVSDGDADDASGDPGVVVFMGELAGWNINAAAGLSKPALGSASLPLMDMSSINVSGSSGSVTIELTDTGFNSAFDDLLWRASIGGVTNGMVSYQLYGDAGNTAFGRGNLLADLGPFSPVAFSGSESAISHFGGGNDFALTLVIGIVHGDEPFTNSSFNAEARAIVDAQVPEPATLALLGIGLAGGFFLLYRRRGKATV